MARLRHSLTVSEIRCLIAATNLFRNNGAFGSRAWPLVYIEDALPQPILDLVGEGWSGSWDDLVTADAAAVANGAASILTRSVDSLLGIYTATEEEIILYVRPLTSFACHSKTRYHAVFAVVLIHEFGHWITHRLPHPESNEWQLDSYANASEEVHEGWAELISWWIAKQLGEEFMGAHEKLNVGQPDGSPYLFYRRLLDFDIRQVCKSLISLRKINKAGDMDWFGALLEIGRQDDNTNTIAIAASEIF